jgi:diadenosine tetraphosphate (Ap4A) HIT family hydrolase
MSDFVLDARLAADTLPVVELAHCSLRLMNDSRYAWAVLVPRIEGATELFALPAARRRTIEDEVASVAARLADWPGTQKVNIGALGNIVRQLHIHVVARKIDDPAWPGPVWGHSPAVVYGSGEADALTDWLLASRL